MRKAKERETKERKGNKKERKGKESEGIKKKKYARPLQE